MFKKFLFLCSLVAFCGLPGKAQTVGTINTVAGGVPNNVAALSVGIGYPSAIARDSQGNFYVAIESGGQEAGGIIKINPNGILTTVAGNGSFVISGTQANGDGGPATQASFAYRGCSSIHNRTYTLRTPRTKPYEKSPRRLESLRLSRAEARGAQEKRIASVTVALQLLRPLRLINCM
jgi:hypothetical protein